MSIGPGPGPDPDPGRMVRGAGSVRGGDVDWFKDLFLGLGNMEVFHSLLLFFLEDSAADDCEDADADCDAADCEDDCEDADLKDAWSDDCKDDVFLFLFLLLLLLLLLLLTLTLPLLPLTLPLPLPMVVLIGFLL